MGFDKTDLNKLAPLVRDYNAWTAFLHLLDKQEAIVIAKLVGKCDSDELIRINAVYQFIQELRKTRDRTKDIERLQ